MSNYDKAKADGIRNHLMARKEAALSRISEKKGEVAKKMAKKYKPGNLGIPLKDLKKLQWSEMSGGKHKDNFGKN